MNATELYEALSVLPVGAQVPDTVCIADYTNGDRPVWTVVGREELGEDGLRIELEDQGNRDMFDCVRVIVLAFPFKVLRTQPQPHGLTPAIIGSKLCDLTQQGRIAQKRAQKRRIGKDEENDA